MIHARADYNRVQDLTTFTGDKLTVLHILYCIQDAYSELADHNSLKHEVNALVAKLEALPEVSVGSTPFGENEPVVLFRAQDVHMADVLKFYRANVLDNDQPSTAVPIALSVTEHIDRVYRWQSDLGCKAPDL